MLGDDIAAVLPELRAHAESRMTAACTITRLDPTADPVQNPVTFQVEQPTVTVYTGICRARATANLDHGASVADQVFIESQYVLHLPVDTSGDVRKDDTVTITSSPDDADLVGRTYTVVSVPAGSQTTARRIPVRETQ